MTDRMMENDLQILSTTNKHLILLKCVVNSARSVVYTQYNHKSQKNIRIQWTTY